MFVVIYNLKNWRKDLIMSVALEQKQGLIAGDGLLPVKMAQYAKENGFDVVAISLSNDNYSQLKNIVQKYILSALEKYKN